MEYKKHCEHCKKVLGNEWYVVHRWLDEFSKQDIANHRRARHHPGGIAEVRKKWGTEAEQAAIIHIMDDFGFIPDEKWYNENWIEN